MTSPTGRRVAAFAGDSRPAWLWSADGESLAWANDAARRFAVKASRRGQRGSTIAVPIRGQIARLVRLGTAGNASLARIQFLIGDRPVSNTCTCTPLTLPDGTAGMLIVGVDPLEGESTESWARIGDLLPRGLGFAVRLGDEIVTGSHDARDADATVALAGGAELLLFAGDDASASTPATTVARPAAVVNEPPLPLGMPEVPDAIRPPAATSGDTWAEIEPLPERDASLASLFDRLADESQLFEPIEDTDEAPIRVSEPRSPSEVIADLEPQAELTSEVPTDPGPAADEPPTADTATPDLRPVLYRVLARRIRATEAATEPQAETLPIDAAPASLVDAPVAIEAAASESDSEDAPEAVGERPAPTTSVEDVPVAADDDAPHLDDAQVDDDTAPEPDLTENAESEGESPTPDSVERTSRYNFDELSRILTDRVGQDGARDSGRGLRLVASGQGPAGDGALVSLGSETLVLNRLPLGILVFRDQQVLFANRAITDMIGYESVEGLRRAGLAAIFPAASDERQEAGPVNHLVQRDGTLLPVTARLQSIAWQGRPALMLSASATEVRTGHEAAVRAFAEMLADQRGDGFIEATRNGMITGASAAAVQMIGRPAEQIVGKPLLALVTDNEDAALKAFLERPARFAETARPALSATSSLPDTELQLYAQGQAGVVTGYFGFLHRKAGASRPALPPPGDIDPALLGRLSRGLRRPLNTIVGFSELMRSGTFGAEANPRYSEYARDINSAGQEIAALVDELDDYARLKDGRYQPRTAEIDLGALLESCVVRIRAQAGNGRVLVRSAISETLPRVRADRASLGQAVLNLLSSAIDQTPAGGAVVLSAHLEDDGSVLVHVREQGAGRGDLGDSFVIFRDGVAGDGKSLAPVRSSVGLALTRSLLEVNAASLSVEAAGEEGTIFSLRLPPETVIRS